MGVHVAIDDERHALGEAAVLCQRQFGLVALTHLEQFDGRARQLRCAVGTDGFGIGAVGPGDVAVLVREPSGHRQSVEQTTASRNLARQVAMLIEQAREIPTVADDVAQTQQGATSRGTPVCFQVRARRCADQQIERATVGEQRVERAFQFLRRCRVQPSAEALQMCEIGRQPGNAR